jgi:hypothetical protein
MMEQKQYARHSWSFRLGMSNIPDWNVWHISKLYQLVLLGKLLLLQVNESLALPSIGSGLSA